MDIREAGVCVFLCVCIYSSIFKIFSHVYIAKKMNDSNFLLLYYILTVYTVCFKGRLWIFEVCGHRAIYLFLYIWGKLNDNDFLQEIHYF